MKKTIQIQNPNINKKEKEKTFTTSKVNALSFSLVAPLLNLSKQFGFFVETLKKIKQENYSKFELILVNNATSKEILQLIENEDIFKVFREQNILKILNSTVEITKIQAITLGITEASKENVLVFDFEKLNNSFNINDLFNQRKDLSDKIGVPVFQQKEKQNPNPYNYSMLLGDTNLLGYLYQNVCKNSKDYRFAINYQLKQADIETEEIAIFQSNPFTEIKKPDYFTKLYKNFVNRINWFLIIPFKELGSKPNRELLPKKLKESSVFRMLFTIVAAITFLAMPMMAYHTGNSGDEDLYQYPQAVKIYNYYTSFGKDTTYTNAGNSSMEGMRDYGMSFDTLTVFFNKIFNIDNVFESRHAMNALVGWLAFLFCGLIAFRIANWRAALITFFLMFFSPQFLGQTFNNPKDVPFAMAYIFTIYYIIRFLQQFPKPTKKTVFYLALGIAMAISVRIGGLILLAYLVMFVGLYFLFTSKVKALFSADNIIRFKKLATYSIVIAIAGYFMGLILWPYALQAPISNPLKSLTSMTNFGASLRQIFEGISIWSDKVPPYYTIKYIMITAPISVIIGSVIYLFLLKKKDMQFFWAFILLFSFGFPIFYIVWKHSNVYGGWRHALFTYPALVVAAGLGFNSLIEAIKNKYMRIAGGIIVVLLTINPIIHTFKNHPYQYVYFNEIVGGVKGAYGNYEMDYYFHSLREATEWVKQNASKDANVIGKKIKVGAWLTPPVSYYLRKDTAKFEVAFIRYYERGNNDWDYAIFVNTGINPDQLRNGTWPPKNAVHTIDVDGKPICAILKRTDKSDMLGSQALEKGDFQTAIPLLQKAVELLPTNESALLNLGDAYIKIQQMDSAMLYINQLLKFDPELDNALNFQAYIYLAKNDVENSLKTANRIIKNNYKYYFAYYWAANAYIRKNDSYSAIKMLEKLLEQNQGFKPAYQMLAQIYQQQGDNERAQYYANIANQM
jgi:tetratricopeptide (TPR) repeat protein